MQRENRQDGNCLAEMDFEVVYRAGIKYEALNSISRL